MRILYVFPHPDDESFGPAHVMSKQRREGHEVHLLTLTRGGATRQRHRYGYSVDEMGEARFREMQNVARVLDLTGMTVLDLPDSGLREMDPRDIEQAVAQDIVRLRPDVVVTYPVHGISGFPDHLVTHAAVKRTCVEMKAKHPLPRRLAFFTITEEHAKEQTHFSLTGSKPEDIDCLIHVEPVDIERARRALDCYVTFQETIEKTGIRDQIREEVPFEIFQESHNPPLSDLFMALPGGPGAPS